MSRNCRVHGSDTSAYTVNTPANDLLYAQMIHGVDAVIVGRKYASYFLSLARTYWVIIVQTVWLRQHKKCLLQLAAHVCLSLLM